MDRYKKSLDYLARARQVTPGGAQTLSKMAARFPEGAYPVAIESAAGARVTDLDGNECVDWICSLGAITLGYATWPEGVRTLQGASYVCEKVRNQMILGPLFSLPSPLEAEVAERLCAKIPCAEMVRFVNSGSEATEAAIRTARIATGRDLILTVKNGYHGWHSWFQAVKDWHPGVPEVYGRMIDGIGYNNFAELDEMFATYDYAAMILEPTLFQPPQSGFLESIREHCTKRGTLLIFDEVVCGGRWALAGGQEYFGVTPDLATYGKGLANGLPIGILCGKREYMRHAELVSGTFGGNALSLAAVSAVLDVYETEPVIETMWRRGKQLQDFFNAQAKAWDVNAVCDGYHCKPRIRFTQEPEKAMSLFLQICAEEGVLFHPGGFNVCAALTDDDMFDTKVAVEQALKYVSEAVKSNDWKELTGKLCTPVVTVRS